MLLHVNWQTFDDVFEERSVSSITVYLGLLEREEGGIMFLRNLGSYLPVETQ
jgi:hypothetical protein